MRKLIVYGLLSLCGSAVLLNQTGCGGDSTNSNASRANSSNTTTTTTTTTSSPNEVALSQPYISGTVTDESGAGIKKAQVTVISRDTNEPSTFETDPYGFYVAYGLRAGWYRVIASAEGFSSQEGNVQARRGEGVQRDFVLARRKR